MSNAKTVYHRVWSPEDLVGTAPGLGATAETLKEAARKLREMEAAGVEELGEASAEDGAGGYWDGPRGSDDRSAGTYIVLVTDDPEVAEKYGLGEVDLDRGKPEDGEPDDDECDSDSFPELLAWAARRWLARRGSARSRPTAAHE